jgi:dihydrofolate reductase
LTLHKCNDYLLTRQRQSATIYPNPADWIGIEMKVTMMMAITADGMIARDHAHFPDWTCRADKQMFKALTQKAGVVIFGSRTFRTIGKPLAGRLNIVLTRHPERYQPFENVEFCSDHPEKLVADLAGRGYPEVILAGGAIINTVFAKSRLIDEMLLTVAPKVFGQGLPMFSEACDLTLELLKVQTLESHSLVLHYRVIYP